MLDSASPRSRSYTDLDPQHKWLQGDEADTLCLDVSGFSKEQMKILINTSAKIKISGERHLKDRKWIRFLKEFKNPINCNPKDIQVKLDKGNGLLYILLPKNANQVGNQEKRLDAAGEDNQAPLRFDADEGGNQEKRVAAARKDNQAPPRRDDHEGGNQEKRLSAAREDNQAPSRLDDDDEKRVTGIREDNQVPPRLDDDEQKRATAAREDNQGSLRLDDDECDNPKKRVAAAREDNRAPPRLDNDEGGNQKKRVATAREDNQAPTSFDDDEGGNQEKRVAAVKKDNRVPPWVDHDEGSMHGPGMYGPELGMSGIDGGTIRHKLLIINVVAAVMVLLGIGGYAVYRIWFADERKEN